MTMATALIAAGASLGSAVLTWALTHVTIRASRDAASDQQLRDSVRQLAKVDDRLKVIETAVTATAERLNTLGAAYDTLIDQLRAQGMQVTHRWRGW